MCTLLLLLLVRSIRDHQSADHSQLRWNAADGTTICAIGRRQTKNSFITLALQRARPESDKIKEFREIMQCGWLATAQFTQSIARCHHAEKKHHRIRLQQ